MRSSWLLVFALASACTAEDDLGTDDVVVPEDDGKADAATELRVRTSDTTLWVDRALERRGDAFVLTGRTSRTLTDGNAFIFDDVYGDFTKPSARTFEVSWPVSTARTVADGVNLFTSLHFTHSSSRPDHLTARVVVRPRLTAITATSTLALTAELTPIVVAGRTLYRVKGRSTKVMSELTSTLGTPRLVDPNHFELDLTFDQVSAAGAQVAFTAQLATSQATITAGLGLSIKRLGLTAGDIERVYPIPSCTAAARACLLGLPDGALDLATCGEAIRVYACRGQVGVVVDAEAVAAAGVDAEARLTGAFASDAAALVGSSRVTALTTAVRGKIAERLTLDRGLWLVTPAARKAVLAQSTDGEFDAAYARPLAHVPAFASAPNDVARARQVAADALLAYLAVQDYVHSEFGRSYDELTRTFRTQHVTSIREFRETNTSETFSNAPNIDIYTGQWLGTHTEISIDRTTGIATHVLVELD